jgi:hypothetical protein
MSTHLLSLGLSSLLNFNTENATKYVDISGDSLKRSQTQPLGSLRKYNFNRYSSEIVISLLFPTGDSHAEGHVCNCVVLGTVSKNKGEGCFDVGLVETGEGQSGTS